MVPGMCAKTVNTQRSKHLDRVPFIIVESCKNIAVSFLCCLLVGGVLQLRRLMVGCMKQAANSVQSVHAVESVGNLLGSYRQGC